MNLSKMIKFIELPINENSQLLTLQQVKREYQRISFDETEEGLSAFMSIPTEPYKLNVISYEDIIDEHTNNIIETKEIHQEEDGEVRKHAVVYVTEIEDTLLPYQKLVNNFTVNDDGTYNCTQSIVHMSDEEIYNLRKRAYITTDKLKAAIENEALFDGVEPDYTEWINAVQAVKEKYPKQNEVG